MVFFFKQKTAYEMRISDWSSDVCSSDLYTAFDAALWQIEGQLSDANIQAAAQKAGVDWARLQRDEKAHAATINGLLSQTGQQAAMMGLQGTPGLLIGPYMIPGALAYAGLTKAWALERTKIGRTAGR